MRELLPRFGPEVGPLQEAQKGQSWHPHEWSCPMELWLGNR